MTEDDTFKILRRLPVDETCRRRNSLFGELVGKFYSKEEINLRIEELTISLGWESQNEYYTALMTHIDKTHE